MIQSVHELLVWPISSRQLLAQPIFHILLSSVIIALFELWQVPDARFQLNISNFLK